MYSVLLTTFALTASLASANIVDSAQDSYDFVVVGGGLAGLVLGGRLSEESKYSVLVLEAGSDGDEFREQIDTPGMAYFNSLWNTSANWNFHTAPQANANNIQMEWPRGKVLGGSSAINGLYMVRPGEIEVNAWHDMLGDMDGADNWTWNALFAAMKKSENFSPPSTAIAQEGGITWDSASHGEGGPIHMSWPGYTFPMVGDWATAPPAAGVAVNQDPYGGENWGAYVSMSCINPTNWTRSYSRTGYLDPLPPRSNYDVLPNAWVSRLIFDSSSKAGNLTANSVEYTMDGGATYQTVNVTKEVILAGGSIGSPTVLLYSGVGPSDVLSSAGVPVVLDLPGVGQRLQDHLSVEIQWNTSEATAGSIYEAGGAPAENPAFLSYVNDAIAYVSATTLFGSSAVSSMQSSINSQMDDFAPSDSTVAAGYNTIYQAVANTIFPSELGQVELLIGNNLNGAINLGASLQHPLSMGSITINSANPMDYPIIDPAYLTNPADIQILVAGMQKARQIGESQPLAGIMTETWPGPSVQTEQEWEEFIRDNCFTEYHPSSTCAMLPLDQGGVVDANLLVYGLSNVRVADASVPPLEFSAHLMSSTYGIAEQASDIIKNYYSAKEKTVNPTDTTTDTSHKSGGESHHSGKGSSSSSSSSSSKNAGSRTTMSPVLVGSALLAACALFGLP